jgi:hypothetical protein
MGAVWLSAAAGFASAAPLDKGLLAYLPLRVDLQDHSPAENPVKMNGGVELREGGAYFNGQTNWLELPHFDFDKRPFAVSMWIKTTGANPMYGLLEQQAEHVPNRWLHIMLRGGRQPYLGFYVNDAISPQDVPLKEWAHLVFQYTGTHQQLWIDGQLLCSRAARAYDGNAGKTVIGRSPRWNNVPSKDFEGYMREIRIYGRALSADEIGSLFNRDNDSGAKAILQQSREQAPDSGSDAAEVGIPFLAIDGGKLVITGESHQVYEIMATSDLGAAWQPLVTMTNQSGVVEYTDPEAANIPQRFYRIKVK